MEKLIRSLMVGFILSVIALIGSGWKAYGEMNSMGKTIKSEVKAEMMEVRNRDMEYFNHRLNLIETLMVGRVVNQMPVPEATK